MITDDIDTEDEAVAGGMLSGIAERDGRLDIILTGLCPGLSRTRLKNLILEGAVTVDGKVCRIPSADIFAGHVLAVDVPAPVKHYPEPEAIPLDVVYEDEALLVINKQAGLVVHPGAGNHTGTLVNALLHHCGDSLSGIGGVLRPGIVHRLDKDTTGLMVVAKSDAAHQGLANQLSDRTLRREYVALAWKVPMLPVGHIDAPLGRSPSDRLKMAVIRRDGRHAVTHYKVRERYHDAASLIDCRLETGRTHQVRVHLAHIGHPLAGDPLYGLQATAQRALMKKAGMTMEALEAVIRFPRQALHAGRIGFIHPLTEQEMAFEAPIPQDFDTLINCFKANS